MSKAVSPLRYKGVLAKNPPAVVRVARAPAATDTAYRFNTIWVDTSTDDVYLYSNPGTWTILGYSASSVADVPHGGTGLATITDHGVMVGSGTSAVTPLAVGTNGQVLLGSTGADPAFGTLTSGDSSVSFTTGAGTLALAVTQATTSQLGGAEVATSTEAQDGTSSAVMITPSNLESLKSFTKITFASNPITCQSDGTATSGVDTETDVAVFDNGVLMEYYNIGTQTTLTPNMSASGLTISRTETDNIGTEYGFGILATSKHAYTAQTDACYLKASFTVADVSGTDPLIIGFRKIGAYNSTYTSYTDYAAIGIIGENNPAKIQIDSNLNGAGHTLTDTTDTWVDGATHVLEVFVDAAGAVTYTIDGVAPSVTAAFTFDAADVIVPFVYYQQATTNPGKVYMQSIECGLQ